MHKPSLAIPDAERENRQSRIVSNTQKLDTVVGLPDLPCTPSQLGLPAVEPFLAQRLLDQHRQRGADVAGHVRGSALFARRQAAGIDMPPGRYEADGPPSGKRRN